MLDNQVTTLSSIKGLSNQNIIDEVDRVRSLKDLFLLSFRYSMIDVFFALIESERVKIETQSKVINILEIKVGEVWAVSPAEEEENFSTLSKDSKSLIRYELVTPGVQSDMLIGEIKLNVSTILSKLLHKMPQDMSGFFSGDEENIYKNLLQLVLNNRELFDNDESLDDNFNKQYNMIIDTYSNNILTNE